MKRLAQAPNIAIATLWADMLTQAGIAANVQRLYTSSIAGEIPPDQALPEVWVLDETQFDAAQAQLRELQHPPWRHWVCQQCHERIDGPFDQCWQCGAMGPAW
ncbi:putative signal transducing protein [Ideonella sp. BN130291]|uniref:putative signal transducing protein n=1 Tax=Ideonella sp. BN130291 TaxID=3112940 RepID=UPI002E25DB08|nr:DUF2007 domain-containing protein [Ideonella sp. BN130291]